MIPKVQSVHESFLFALMKYRALSYFIQPYRSQNSSIKHRKTNDTFLRLPEYIIPRVCTSLLGFLSRD